ISVFDTSALKWLTVIARGDSVGARSGHSAVLSAVVPLTPQPALVLNSNLYIFDTKNNTWIKGFNASDLGLNSEETSDNKKDK
ncbi:22754_t:CDS:2, partial [Racocetra persica]